MIEILKDTLKEWECDISRETIEQIAEHLIQNGVIVPPCKVGDKVYVITEKHPCYACMYVEDFCHKQCPVKDKSKLVVKEAKVYYFLYQETVNKVQLEVAQSINLVNHFLHLEIKDFGKTVFLKKEEAERKLKEVGE